MDSYYYTRHATEDALIPPDNMRQPSQVAALTDTPNQ